jgi:hypothetical protein
MTPSSDKEVSSDVAPHYAQQGVNGAATGSSGAFKGPQPQPSAMMATTGRRAAPM